MANPLTDRSALVVGGTAGIGAAVAVKLASLGARVTIAGRNADKGADVVSRMQVASGDAAPGHELRRLDASSLEAVRAFTTELADAWGDEPLDFLVMCQSKASFGGREPTAEGFEIKLVLHAYSRFLLTQDLLPRLRRGRSVEDAAGRVLSVLSGGIHGTFTDWADADLKTSFSLRRAADAAGFYNDLGFQQMADDPANSAVGFLHAAPGFVASNWGHQTKAAFFIKLAQKAFAKSADQCAEILVNAMRDPRYARGFHCVNERGEPTHTTSAHTADNVSAMQAHLKSVYAAVGLDEDR